MKKISAKEAYKILRNIGLDCIEDGVTFYAYDEDSKEVYSFDTKRERDAFVEKRSRKEMKR